MVLRYSSIGVYGRADASGAREPAVAFRAGVHSGKPKGFPAALVPGLLVAPVIGAGPVRADTLSDCKTGAPAVAVKACTMLVNAGPGQEVEFEARYYRALAYARQLDSIRRRPT